jgi:uncharacterized membrane protein YeaQ/YmgE (transglycosylase-associated protein family)
MFYSIWLSAAALAGWAAGKIAGRDGFGTGADILLGITGAFMIRWSLENIGISVHAVYLLLFSIWGEGAFPALVRFGIRRHNRSGLEHRATLISLGSRQNSMIFPGCDCGTEVPFLRTFVGM